MKKLQYIYKIDYIDYNKKIVTKLFKKNIQNIMNI